MHRTADTLVPTDQSRRIVAAAQRVGDIADLRVFDGDHVDPITVGIRA